MTTYHTIDDFKPTLYAESIKDSSNHLGFPGNRPLDKITFASIKEYKDYLYRNKDVENRFYGNIDVEYQYINEHYNKQDMEQARYWFADIETDVDKGGFPTADKNAVTFIQIYDNIRDEIYIFAWQESYKPTEKDVKYILCDDEKDMLDKFLKLYFHLRPNVVTGINFVHFDTRYLIDRFNHLGYEKNILSPFGKSYTHKYSKFNKSYEVEMPIGVTWIDYMDIVDTHAYLKLGGKSLEVLSNKVLGDDIGKLKWRRYFKSFHDMAKFIYSPPYDITDEEKQEDIYLAYVAGDEVEVRRLAHIIFTNYAILDVRLLKEIDKKLGMMDVMYSYAWSMGCNLDDALKTVVPWDTMLYGTLMHKNLITASFHGEDEKYSIAGGYWNSTPGLWRDIASFDFKSQYPIGAVTLNICPSTHIKQRDIPSDLQALVEPLQKVRMSDGKIKDRDDNMFTYMDMPDITKEQILELCKKYNYTFAPNGTFYSKDFKGELPLIIEEIFNKRVEYKAIMEQAYKDGDIVKGNIYKIKQLVEKIKINSLYGYISSRYFKLGSPDLGGAITAFGRFSLMSMKNAVNKVHRKATGKDIVVSNSATDANYFVLSEISDMKFKDKNPSVEERTKFLETLIDKVIQPAIDSNLNEDFRLMNGYVNMMGVNREVIATHGLVTGISKYSLRVTNDEGKALYDKPKMKTVGMPNISVTLPKSVRKALDDVVNIFFDGINDDLIDYIDEYKKRFATYKPSEISQLIGCSTVAKYDEQLNKEDEFTNDTKQETIFWVSKASIIYNQILEKNELQYEFDAVGENDKVMLIYLKRNPITKADVIAYKDDAFLDKVGLRQYIDIDRHFKALFLEAVTNFCTTNGWKTDVNDALMDIF